MLNRVISSRRASAFTALLLAAAAFSPMSESASALAAPAAGSGAAGSGAAGSGGQPGQPAGQQRGSVVGTVLGVARKPVADVCVTAIPDDRAQPTGPASVTSGAGIFALSGLLPGLYELRYRWCAFPASRAGQPGSPAGRATPLPEQRLARVLVTAGRSTTARPLVMRSASSASTAGPMPRLPRERRLTLADLEKPAGGAKRGGVSGRVTGPHGKHVAGLCYEVHTAFGFFGAAIGRDGKYSTGKILPPGRYTVEFTPLCDFNEPPTGNWAPQWYRAKFSQASATTVVIRSGQITTGIGGVMRPGGVLGGTVTGRSGRAVAGVCVLVAASDNSAQQQVATSAHGKYKIEALDPGKYKVAFIPAGCQDTTRTSYLAQWWPGVSITSKPGTITLRLGQHRAQVNAKLVVGGTITGTVRFRNRHGHPIRGICVFVDPASNPFGSTEFDAATRPDGRYRVSPLPTGKYDVSFGPGCRNNGNFLFKDNARVASAHTGQVTPHVDWSMQPGAIVTGRITDAATGRPLAGICVEAGDSIGGSRKNGSYIVTQISPGRTTVSFSNCGNPGSFEDQFYPRALTLRGGVTARNINARMRPGSTISGTVTTATGHKLSGVCVDAIPAADAGSGPDAVFSGIETQSSAGHYEIPNLTAGQYQVTFRACGFDPDVVQRWFMQRPGHPTGDRISLPPGGVISGVSAALHPGGGISGTIDGPAHQLQSFVCTTVTDARSHVVVADSFGVSEGEGYGLNGFAPGRYIVEFSPCGGQNLALQWYDRASRPAKARQVRIVAHRTTSGIGARMTVGGSLTGRVVARATGRPIAGVCVFAAGIGQPFAGLGATSKSGQYQIIGLNTGSYRLTFSACANADLRPRVAPQAVRVTAGKTTVGPRIAMSTYRPGTITGRVRGGGGSPAPAAGVCATAFPASAHASSPGGHTRVTDAHGFYRIGHLVPGRYRVFFDPSCATGSRIGHLIPQWSGGAASRSAAKIVVVSAGKTTRSVGAVLASDGTITGTVTQSVTGTALHGSCVQAIPVAGGQAPLLAVSGTHGGYKLPGLRPGRYRVEFSAGCGTSGYVTQWWHGAASAATAAIVRVRSSAVSPGIDAAMSRS